MENDERRKKIILKSLELSFKHKKGLLHILIKLHKEKGLENLNEVILKEGNSFNLLKMMFETGEILYTELYDTSDIICNMWGTLTDDQKRILFEELLKEGSIIENSTEELLIDGRLYSDFTPQILKENMYNIKFLNSALNHRIPLDYIMTGLDYKRIINDPALLDFYANNTHAIDIMNRNIKLTSEEAEKLLEYGFVWSIKYCDKKNDMSFIYELIQKYPQKFSFKIIQELLQSEEQRDMLLFSLASNSAETALYLCDKDIVRQNIYSIGIQNLLNRTYLGMMGWGMISAGKDYCSFDKKLYVLLNAPNLADLSDHKIESLLSEEEKKYLKLFDYREDNNYGEDKEINQIHIYSSEKNIINKNRFKKLLATCAKKINVTISEEQINNFMSSYKDIVDILADKFRLDDINNACNICYAIKNDTVDLYSELIQIVDPAYMTNMKYITKELVNTLGNDVIKNIAIYPDSLFYLLILEKQNRLNTYISMLKKVQKLPINNIQIYNILIYSCISYPNLVDNMIKTNTINEENIIKLINFTKCIQVKNVSEYKTIEEAYQDMDNFYDEKIKLSSDINITKQLLSHKYFQGSYNSINYLYNTFKASKDKIKSDELKQTIKLMETLINSSDNNEIKQVFSNAKITNTIELERKLKQDLLVNFVPNVNITNEGIIDLTGKEFDLLVHVVGAYGSTIKADSLYQSWNSQTRFTNTGICTSLLNDNYFGRAKEDKNSVIFGFDNIQADDIQMMAPYDLWSNTNGVVSASREMPSYYRAKDLVNRTRAWHNEVVINRQLPDGTKRQPKYILCFDKINEDSKKASQQFNIPIVFINTEKHIEIKNQNIEDLKQEYINSQNPELAEKIIQSMRIIRCGLLANNQNLAEQYFSQSKIETMVINLIENSISKENVDQIIQNIYKEYNLLNDLPKDYREDNIKINIDLIFRKAEEQKQKIEQGYTLPNPVNQHNTK